MLYQCGSHQRRVDGGWQTTSVPFFVLFLFFLCSTIVIISYINWAVIGPNNLSRRRRMFGLRHGWHFKTNLENMSYEC